MKRIAITVTDESYALLVELAARCNSTESSHGALTVRTLMELLAEDAVLAVRRPGSWEGAGLLAVLAHHGYEP